MARLPQPGADSGKWGDILNDYLSQSHTASGTLKDNTVGSAQLQDNAVTNSTIAPDAITATEIQDGTIQEAQLASAVQSKLNNSNTSVTSTDITDATALGRSLLTSSDVTSARTIIGAGTSNLALAGTGVATTAAKTDHTQAASTISDSTPVGRAVLTASDQIAGRSALGINTAQLANTDYRIDGRLDIHPRLMMNNAVVPVSGEAIFTHFTPGVDMTISELLTSSEYDSTMSDATLCKIGLYSYSATVYTCIARSAHNATRWNGGSVDIASIVDNGESSPLAITSVTLNAGQEYALAILVVSPTGTIKVTSNYMNGALAALPPRICASKSGLSDLPAVTDAGSDYRVIWGAIQ